MKIKILEPTSDTVFKAFMMSKKTNRCKARMIHLITGIDEGLLKNADYQSIELPVPYKESKVYKTDVIVKVDKHLLSIEMNQAYYSGLPKKNAQYLKKVAGESYEKGETYDDRMIIQLNFDCYDQYKRNKLIYRFQMMETVEHFIDDENYKKYNINLDSVRRKCYTNDENEELINILKLFTVKSEEELEVLRGENYMNDAIDEIKRLCQDKNIIGLYDAEAVAKKEMNSRHEYALEQGIEKGIEQQTICIAKRLKNMGIPIEDIMTSTGLSRKEIERL